MSSGFTYVRDTIFNPQYGARSVFSVPRILVSMSDGKSNPGFEPMAIASQLQSQYGVKIYSIGMGNGADYTIELAAAASVPSDRYMFQLSDATALPQIVTSLRQVRIIPPYPPTLPPHSPSSPHPLTHLPPIPSQTTTLAAMETAAVG